MQAYAIFHVMLEVVKSICGHRVQTPRKFWLATILLRSTGMFTGDFVLQVCWSCTAARVTSSDSNSLEFSFLSVSLMGTVLSHRLKTRAVWCIWLGRSSVTATISFFCRTWRTPPFWIALCTFTDRCGHSVTIVTFPRVTRGSFMWI